MKKIVFFLSLISLSIFSQAEIVRGSGYIFYLEEGLQIDRDLLIRKIEAVFPDTGVLVNISDKKLNELCLGKDTLEISKRFYLEKGVIFVSSKYLKISGAQVDILEDKKSSVWISIMVWLVGSMILFFLGGLAAVFGKFIKILVVLIIFLFLLFFLFNSFWMILWLGIAPLSFFMVRSLQKKQNTLNLQKAVE